MQQASPANAQNSAAAVAMTANQGGGCGTVYVEERCEH